MRSLFESMNQSFERKFNSLKEGNCSECDDIRFNDDTDYEVDESCDARKARIKEACRCGNSSILTEAEVDVPHISVDGWDIRYRPIDEKFLSGNFWEVYAYIPNSGATQTSIAYDLSYDQAIQKLESVLKNNPKYNRYGLSYSSTHGYVHDGLVTATRNYIPAEYVEDIIINALQSDPKVAISRDLSFDGKKHPGYEGLAYVRLKDEDNTTYYIWLERRYN